MSQKRTLDQNKKMHAMLADISHQLEHPHGGEIGPEAWKALFLEQLGFETKWLRSIDGQRMVPLRWSSKALEKEKFSDLIELMTAYGSEHGVQWSDPEWVSQMAALRLEAA